MISLGPSIISSMVMFHMDNLVSDIHKTVAKMGQLPDVVLANRHHILQESKLQPYAK
jgi:hypothetical protein